MKRYIWGRIIRAILSVFIVTAVAMIMIYTLIPRELIFKTDATYQKLGGKEDDRNRYKYNAYEKLGYVDFVEQTDMCGAYASDNYDACMVENSSEIKSIIPEYEAKGYTIQQYRAGLYYAYKDTPILSIVGNFFSNLIDIDHPWRVTDDSNPELNSTRGIYWGLDYNGLPALMGNGTEHQYLIYVDGNFPFIHQNIISINLGLSYPAYSYTPITQVISSSQGSEDTFEQTFPTGQTIESAVIQHSCQYKATENLDRLDTNKYTDNYAECLTQKTDPSMIQDSMTIGIIALILAYCISIPAGMGMARHKGKLGDHIGTIWINFMIAVPSLAFIFFGRQIFYLLGLPQSFPTFGAHDIRSYIPAVVILALMNTASLMLWTRRYMIDQENADYVKFARAKGLTEKEIFRRHILRNAIIPIVHDIPANVILTITGAVLTETVFAIPGTGKLLPDAINDHNNQMIVALTMIFTALSIMSVLLGDLLMTAIDPRIQLEEKEGGAH
ncbi:MAG: ABC transporter permease [Erysipelotrichaceae bacterium]|jgi:oligopeptide transport system permease protein|nr:ABC transporter permease [Erysipelotrichaceae bacterium]